MPNSTPKMVSLKLLLITARILHPPRNRRQEAWQMGLRQNILQVGLDARRPRILRDPGKAKP